MENVDFAAGNTTMKTQYYKPRPWGSSSSTTLKESREEDTLDPAPGRLTVASGVVQELT